MSELLPTDEAFAVSHADREVPAVNAQPWKVCGAWKHRQFGDEVQLRNAALPHLALDLYRSEAEDLHAALGEVLGKPAQTPFRLSRWERVKQWWLRAVWKRRHYAEMKRATDAQIEFFTRKGPWG